MSNNWIDIKEVELQLRNKDTSILDDRQVSYCISDDYQFCVFLRYHQAWYIDNEGWRDANTPPKKGEQGRQVLNFFKLNAFWFKMFVPQKIEIKALKATATHYIIFTNTGQIEGSFSSLPKLIVQTVTGNAVEELEIEAKFAKIAFL